MPDHSRFTLPRSVTIAAVAVATLAACDGGGLVGGGGGASDFSIDGSGGGWTSAPGSSEEPGDAQFHRHGVATGVQLRAHDGERSVELFGMFLGQPEEPVFVEVQVRYEDGQGTVFERRPTLDSEGKGAEGIRWQRLELDHEDGTGRATVELDIPVCVDQYSGPLEYETVCHQIEGRFDTALVHNPRLRVLR